MSRITEDDVLGAIREHGPIIPNQIKQRLGQSDSMLINVYISQLQEQGKVKTTDVQLGSSSFAYTPDQKDELAQLTTHLNEKNERVANKLRKEKAMRASTAEPIERVALKNIPDFAKPLQVKTKDGEELFYRWYQVGREEAEQKIKELLGVAKKQAPEKEAPEETTTQEEPTKQTASTEETTKKEPEEETQKQESQTRLAQIEPEGEFGQQLLAYFEDKGIAVRDYETIRKNSHVECTVELPTAVGNIRYHCVARNKKNSNDGDLAAAILSAKGKMLPALYITTGNVTNKAKENPDLGEVRVVELGNEDN